jgi:hypothetical protein
MIRRQVDKEFFLITQSDHAQISSQLADHFGNTRFPPSNPRQSTFVAAAEHDAGWSSHDENPTLDSQGHPLDVFQTPRTTALKLWTASADRAAATNDPYALLLVSLHSMHLGSTGSAGGDRHEQFQINKFHHREVERQEQIRRRLGLSTDLPLTLGLVEPNISAAEDLLRYNFQILEFVDLLSLWVCCRPTPIWQTAELSPPPACQPITLRFTEAASAVHVDPWPFSIARIDVQIPFRRLPVRSFTDEAEFRRLYHAAPREMMQCSIERA